MAATKNGAATAKPDKSKPKKPAVKRDAAGVSAPDWERIELEYRAGIRTLREIAGDHGITEGAVRKRAKRDDWTRDLSERINAKADHLVRKELVRSEVRSESSATEREVVDANAQAVANVKLAHRKDIQRNRAIVGSLMDELEKQIGPEAADLLEQLGELMRSPDDNGIDKLNDLYRRIISLPERAKTAKTLAETLRIAVDMERQAFNMDAKQDQSHNNDPAMAKVGRMTDAERAIRLVALLNESNPRALMVQAAVKRARNAP